MAPAPHRFAAMAVDTVVFGNSDGILMVLVAPVNRPPHYVDILGFPGGLIAADENADEASVRILSTKAALEGVYLEQLYTFSEVKRDKRNRVVSVAYLGLIRPDVLTTYTHTEAAFVPVKGLSGLAYDHDAMLQVALKRLRAKCSYTTIAQHLLPRHFTLSELQAVYELVGNEIFDKRNFRKKILALNILKETGRMQEGVKNRPAALYEFRSKKVEELALVV